jgi:hypothetical protein
MSIGTCIKSYYCSNYHFTCEDCICRFEKNKAVPVMDYNKGKLVCPTCEQSVKTLSEEIYLTFRAQFNSIDDARPPASLIQSCKAIEYEDGEFSISLFRLLYTHLNIFLDFVLFFIAYLHQIFLHQKQGKLLKTQ